MGSSFHALHPLNIELVGHGFTVVMAETSELVHYAGRFFDPRTLLVVVSQSGRSAEVVRLVETNRGRSALIAVTNTPDSPLARRADAVVLTRAGQEFSVACKTYVTALMALRWVGGVLCGKAPGRIRKDLKQAPTTVSGHLREWRSHVRSLAVQLDGIRYLFLVGRGASLAAVGAGALIVKESDHFHAEGMSSAAFRHGPMEMVSKETFVLVFSGDARTRALNHRLVKDIREREAPAELVGAEASLPALRLPAAPGSLRPILEILPVEMITLALAARAGREPGRFELASKVTTTE
jgi:glucosamine--fructose-6-phosphate aminotransferase (isomerizing)